MSRYPFMDYVREYMDSMQGYYAEITWGNVMRRFQRMERDLIKLKEEKKISTLSPKNMTVEDVRQLLIFRKNAGTGASDLRHEISAIRGLLAFVENTSAEICMIKNPGLKPKGRQAKLPSMTNSTYEKILARSEGVGTEDWYMTRAYALVLFTLVSSCRNKEIRFMDVDDIDTVKWEFHIIHVKAEDTYGGPRWVPIHPDARPILARYLLLRKKWLEERSRTSKALFPSFSSEDGYLSSNSLRKIKTQVEQDIGEKFDLRKCRRTFGQRYLDAGVSIEAVAVLMGHASTKTTEEFYCRKSNEEASNCAKEVW